jgi:hypothetical protein
LILDQGFYPDGICTAPQAEALQKEYELDGITHVYPICDYYLYPDEAWVYGFADDTVRVVIDEGFDLPFSNHRPPF